MDDNCEVPPLKRRKLNHSENLICPITLEVFKDPVIIEDGNTYEREAILKYLNNNNLSPITREPVNKQIVIPIMVSIHGLMLNFAFVCNYIIDFRKII